MKKQLFRLFTSVIGLSIFLLPGCKKATDYLKDNPTAAYCPCKIRQFNYAGSSVLGTQHGGTDTVRFTYNAAGDPVSGIRVHPGTGYPNWFFRYDGHGRLTDLIGLYGQTDEGFAESWNRYFYDGQDRIVKDSAYFFPGVVDNHPILDPLLFSSVDIFLYEYDAKNRVTKEALVFGSGFTTTYSYDSRGNRIGPVYGLTSGKHSGPATAAYDDKINYHRTSKVWMFIDKDYSVNNPITATYHYNSFGLPVSIVPFTGTLQNFLSVSHTSYEFESATIEYDCNGAL